MKRVIQAGLDLGKVQDPSVLVLTEVQRFYLGLYHVGKSPSYRDVFGHYHEAEDKYERRFRTNYVIRHIERFPLGVPYFEVAERCCDILTGPGLPPATPTYLYIDATGVGQGVVEIVRNTFNVRQEGRAVHLMPISLTSGTAPYQLGSRTCSKHALISRLLKLMGSAEPELIVPADLAELLPMQNELRNFQAKVTQESGSQSYNGAPGVHDDICIALSLSVLVDSLAMEIRYSQRLY